MVLVACIMSAPHCPLGHPRSTSCIGLKFPWLGEHLVGVETIGQYLGILRLFLDVWIKGQGPAKERLKGPGITRVLLGRGFFASLLLELFLISNSRKILP